MQPTGCARYPADEGLTLIQGEGRDRRLAEGEIKHLLQQPGLLLVGQVQNQFIKMDGNAVAQQLFEEDQLFVLRQIIDQRE